MTYLEIENTVTGAEIRVPGKFFHALEAFESAEAGPAADASWEEWTEVVGFRLSEIDDWNGRPHFVFGAWEALTQKRGWREAIDAVLKEGRNEYTDQDQVLVRAGGGDRE